ncbi:MAG: 1-acyl-sn-glycerol-3-phosphate acyltransferase [Bdellovibrionales bacterium]|nr:1-acyl-sn-glycerol-3-phosphate acyltransferase [Bdellovibrionales bacterium]
MKPDIQLIPPAPGLWNRLQRLRSILSYTVWGTLQLGKFAKPDSPFTKADAAEGIKNWAKFCCDTLGLEIHVKGKPLLSEPCLYVSNHVSYVDIPLLMSMLPITFVAKKEVSKWPIFGAATTAAGTVYIDRGSMKSRTAVSQAISDAIMIEKKNIGLFPEGTSSIDVKQWRRGAFGIAQEKGFKVQAIRILYHPLRETAFIDDDGLLPHLWSLMSQPKIEAHIEFFEPIVITDREEDCRRLEKMVRDSFHTLRAELTANEIQ